MEEELLEGDAMDNLESLHKVRLTALLHDLMKEGKLEAAQLLGVNHKTLSAAFDSAVLTPRLSVALEKVLLSRELEAFERVREAGGGDGRAAGSRGETGSEHPWRDRGGRQGRGGAPHRGVDGRKGRRDCKLSGRRHSRCGGRRWVPPESCSGLRVPR